MFKYHTLEGLRKSINNPRCKAKEDVLNGMVVMPDDAIKEAPVPSTVDEAKVATHVVNNIIDKPEIRNSADFKVLAGEYVHADYLPAVDGLLVEIDEQVVSGTYTDIVVNDVLVPAGDGSGKWVKADGTAIVADDYKVNLIVKEKINFGGNGLLALVKSN